MNTTKAVQVKIRNQSITVYYCETISSSHDEGASVLGRGNTPEEAAADFLRRAQLDGFDFESVEIIPAYAVGTTRAAKKPMGRDAAISNALHYTKGDSFSNGDMVVGVSDSHIAIAFGNAIAGAQNQLTILNIADAQQLFACLYPALKSKGLVI